MDPLALAPPKNATRTASAVRRLLAVLLTTLLVASALVVATVTPASATSITPAPWKVLTGGATGLAGPNAMAFDSLGNMYVADSRAVNKYAPDWASGNTAPISTLSGDDTQLPEQPRAIAFDSANNMYIAAGAANSVLMFASGWTSGNVAPTKELTGDNTQLAYPVGLAFDSDDNLYVASTFPNNLVSVYSPDWTGDTAPTKVLSGNSTGIGNSQGIAIDAANNLYTLSNTQIVEHAAGWAAGDTAPTSTLTGGATGLTIARTLGITNAGGLLVASYDPDGVNYNGTLMQFAAGASGNTAPIYTVVGPSGIDSTFTSPTVDASDNIYVIADGPRVLVYPPGYFSAQTVTFATAPSVSIGANGTVSATATGNGAITYTTASSDCTVNPSSGVVVGITAGTNNCVVTATAMATSEWLVGTNTQTISIAQGANQTVSFSPAPDITMGGTGTVTASSNRDGAITYSTASADCSVNASTGVVTPVRAGTNNCVITATAAATTNYPQGTGTQTISIGQGPAQTVTFDSAPTVVVGATGTVAATASDDGIVSYSTASSACSVVSGTGVVSGITAGTGNCVITATAAATTNYLQGTASQTLSIGSNSSDLPGPLGLLCPTGSCAGADLVGVNLSGLDLAGVDFSGANLSGARLVGTNLMGSRLINANLTRAVMSSPSIRGDTAPSFRGKAADLRGANLRGAILDRLTAAGVDLRKANLNGVAATRADFRLARFNRASLKRAKFVGANFSFSDCRYANFTGADLKKAKFYQAKLKGAKFRGVSR